MRKRRRAEKVGGDSTHTVSQGLLTALPVMVMVDCRLLLLLLLWGLTMILPDRSRIQNSEFEAIRRMTKHGLACALNNL